MAELDKVPFDAGCLPHERRTGTKNCQLAPKEAFFSQGEPADSIFYLQKGRAKITVVSHAGKEATITLLSAGDFVGEEALAAVPGPAVGHSHRHNRLHRTQDQAGRDDPRDARGA